jgi:flagellar hook assembly protein FlgD
VYDLRGRKINEILQQTLAAGEHAISWDAIDQEGNPVSAGVYFYKLDTGNFIATRKMILLR